MTRSVCRKIFKEEDLDFFVSNSPAFSKITGYIEILCQSVVGINAELDPLLYPQSQLLVRVLAELEDEISRFPPLQQKMRFGNKAFAYWLKWLREEKIRGIFQNSLLSSLNVSGISEEEVIDELVIYFSSSFGDPIRIDYGTGHELSFLCFLYCLDRFDFFKKEQNKAGLVLLVFKRYLVLMRKLQEVYMLEPAGSHGVWGLDDYHHLPFLFGSAQLINCEKLVTVKEVFEILIKDLRNEYFEKTRNFNLLFEALLVVRKCKGRNFQENSPTLFSMSLADSWAKVCLGLNRMYLAEVLGKRTVVQHLNFGFSLPFFSN